MALFDNLAELRTHNSSISQGLSLSTLQSFIADAIQRNLIPAMGQTTLDELLEAKNLGIKPASKQAMLLQLAQKTCVHFTIANYVPFGALLLSDAGAHVQSDTNLRPASDAKLAALRRQALQDGYHYAELLVDFLEENLVEFPSYAASEAHLENRSRFINNSKTCSESAAMTINAQLFANLRSEISRVERDQIEPILGEFLTKKLRQQIAQGSYVGTDAPLIAQIQRVVAPLALAGMIPYQAVQISASGGYEFAENDPSESNKNQNSSQQARLQQAMLQLNTRGEAELERLKNFLNKDKKIGSINRADSALYFI